MKAAAGGLVTVGYLDIAVIACAAVAVMIVKLRRAEGKGLAIACAVGGLVAILGMVKIRCTIDAYPCGFMSFTGGVTWHIVPSLIAFCTMYVTLVLWLSRIWRLGFQYWAEQLGRSIAPLCGLVLAVVWEVLPVSVIHPPSHGGPCPDLPVICHDVPLLGRGGLLYWTGPFIVWASATFLIDIRRIRQGLG